MSNRFENLFSDSDVEDDVIFDSKKNPDIETKEKTESDTESNNIKITHEKLCLNLIANSKLSNPLIGNAMQYLYDRMKNYHIALPLEKTQVKRIAHFVKYLPPKCEKFFTKECYHFEGSYRGEILSMWSWYFGKFENGKPQYIYITTCENYGSCCFGDRLDFIEDELDTLKSEIDLGMKKSIEFRKNGDDVEADIEAEKCLDKSMRYRSICKSEVYSTFRKLNFFTTYKDAKDFIINRVERYVKFKKHTKKSKHFSFKTEDFPDL